MGKKINKGFLGEREKKLLGLNIINIEKDAIKNPTKPIIAFNRALYKEFHEADVPRNFRASYQEYKEHKIEEARGKFKINTNASREGLDKLNLSGSGTYALYEIKNAFDNIINNNKNISTIYVVDLRQESHGFIDGFPFHLRLGPNRGNVGKQKGVILEEEYALINELRNKDIIEVAGITKKEKGSITNADKIILRATNVQTEEELIHHLEPLYKEKNNVQIKYKRLFVLDFHAPDAENVDDFLRFVKGINPENTWVHVHCAGGKGRATTFSALYDIIRNGNDVTLDDIVTRQYLLGGRNLFYIKPEPDDQYKMKGAKGRQKFIKDFYKYYTSSNGYPAGTSWSKWNTI